LESFVAGHTNSAWAPGIRAWLARNAELRSGYTTALDHYGRVWDAVKGSNDRTALGLASDAAVHLARLLALTGRMEELDTLEAETSAIAGRQVPPTLWSWAHEMRLWARKHPNEAYKCGLYCLDQLGRIAQPGAFSTREIVETFSASNGLSATELLQIGSRAGLQVEAVMLNDVAAPAVPSVLHLRSEHFVVVRERRGGFYNVYDPVAYGARWLTGDEILQEVTGCAIVSRISSPNAGRVLNPAEANAYRGRCHPPSPDDFYDSPCDGCGECPPGRGGSGGGSGGGGSGSGGGGCSHGHCSGETANGATVSTGSALSGGVFGGMPSWFVSEPYLNLWVTDTPLVYNAAYGPPVTLTLNFNYREPSSAIAALPSHGGQIGNNSRQNWSCSWLSYCQLESSENTAALKLPEGGWVSFNFPTGSNVSDREYHRNLWAEKFGTSGDITNIVVHYPDGSQAIYGLRDDTDSAYWWTYHRTELADPTGAILAFTYNGDFLLTNVTAADGVSFGLSYTNTALPRNITGVSSSYGASVAFWYATPTNYIHDLLLGIADAAGITSLFDYPDTNVFGGPLTKIITPYGTTQFAIAELDSGAFFDRTVRITNAVGQQEFYALLNQYSGSDWPDYSASQIPTNTPLATLDTTVRQERNTFYWNAQQFAPYVSLGLYDMTWEIFNNARIRHWLASADGVYTHFDSLSVQQEPSPSGTTNTQGQLTWFDYAGKDTNVVYEIGRQIMPAVIARVMPDGSTAYQYFERLTNG
jgi:hypothetical protein